MADIRRRKYDDDAEHQDQGDPEGWRQREDPMELRLGWGQKSLQARGLGVVLVVIAIMIIGALGYIIEGSERRSALAHDRLIRASDRTGCLLTFEPEDRAKFRERYSPGAFKQWCPWVED